MSAIGVWFEKLEHDYSSDDDNEVNGGNQSYQHQSIKRSMEKRAKQKSSQLPELKKNTDLTEESSPLNDLSRSSRQAEKIKVSLVEDDQLKFVKPTTSQ